MKMITPNKKAKNGFSLVEMLVVIAIIAILVSIIIPVVHHNTVKAAAATNAANLRAIEGKLKIMRLDTPEDFKNYLDMFKDGTLSQLKNDLGTVFDFLFGTGWTEAQLSENFGKKTADNGVLTLEETNVQITGVPTAKKLKVRGTKKFDTVNIEEGTQMSVYITPDTIRAVYIGEDGSVYGVEHFADIAENGKLTNTQIGQTGGSQESGFICDTWGHDIGPDGKCQRTGCTFDSGYHTCIDVKEVIREPFTGAVLYTRDGQDDKCDICGIDMNHACVDNEPKDHRCDAGCGAILSDCDEKQPVDKHNHCCSVCGGNKLAHRYSNGLCLECGRPEHLMPEDCYDELDPGHDCDYPGCGNSNASDCADTNPKDHVCDHQCGNEEIGGACSTSVTHVVGTNTHVCAHCGKNEAPCVDTNPKDHICDQECGNTTIGEHNYYNYGNKNNHKCDYCGTQDHQYGFLSSTCSVCGYNKGGCVTGDTLITLADGTQKRMDEILETDLVLVFDHENGTYAQMPLLYYVNDGEAEYRVINLKFSDGHTTRIIYEHALFDMTLNRYVYIREDTYAEFVGHTFAKDNGNGGFESVVLEEAFVTEEITGCYSITALYHLNYYINGMLSLPGAINGLFNYFEYDPVTLQYNQEQMQADIEEYGLYTYEDFAEHLTQEMFDTVVPVKYLKVSVGKGIVTYDDLVALIYEFLA